MRVTFDPNWLHREMAVRGLQVSDVVEEARVSRPTVTAALNGRRINMTSALAISEALARSKPRPELAGLSEGASVPGLDQRGRVEVHISVDHVEGRVTESSLHRHRRHPTLDRARREGVTEAVGVALDPGGGLEPAEYRLDPSALRRHIIAAIAPAGEKQVRSLSSRGRISRTNLNTRFENRSVRVSSGTTRSLRPLPWRTRTYAPLRAPP